MSDVQRPVPDPEQPPWDPAAAPAAVVGDAPAAPAPAAPAPAAPAPAAPPLAEVIARPRSASGGRGTTVLLALAAAVAVGGLAFAAGRVTAPAATTGRVGQLPGSGQLPGGGQLPGDGQPPSGGQGFPGRGSGLGGMAVSGTVGAISADAITVTLESGTEVTIPLDDETTYHAAASTTAAEVTVGDEVRVTPGTRTADPGASFDPGASPGPGAGISFGAASDVTVVEP